MSRRRVSAAPQQGRSAVELAAWLGAGALTLGVGGVVLSCGCGIAHADDSGASAKSATGTSARHSAGHHAAANHAKSAAVPAAATHAVVTHAAPRTVVVSVADPRPAAAVRPHPAVAAVAAPEAAPRASAVTPVQPLQALVGAVVQALVAIGGMDQAAPTPAPGNLWQLRFYSVARWLADTANPGGIPHVGTVTIGTADPLTGVGTGKVAFTTSAGSPLTYRVSTDGGSATVNPDGSYTFTASTATRLGAPTNGGGTARVVVTAYNGVQSTSQTIDIPITNPLTLAYQTISVGSNPNAVAINGLGTKLVVANNGSNNISVINPANNHVDATIAVGTLSGQDGGSGRSALAFDPAGTGVYVANAGSNSVSAVSFLTNTVVKTIAIGNLTNPYGVVVSGDGKNLYVATVYGLSIVSTTTFGVTGTITVAGSGRDGMALTKDGRLYVANVNGQSVSLINPTTKTVTNIPLAFGSPQGLALSPDGKTLYVANYGASQLLNVNTTTNALSAPLFAGNLPLAVAVSPDGTVVYVASKYDKKVDVVNAATNTVITTIPVGTDPAGLAVSPDGTHLYVTNSGDGTVSVIPV